MWCSASRRTGFRPNAPAAAERGRVRSPDLRHCQDFANFLEEPIERTNGLSSKRWLVPRMGTVGREESSRSKLGRIDPTPSDPGTALPYGSSLELAEAAGIGLKASIARFGRSAALSPALRERSRHISAPLFAAASVSISCCPSSVYYAKNALVCSRGPSGCPEPTRKVVDSTFPHPPFQCLGAITTLSSDRRLGRAPIRKRIEFRR